MNIELNIECWEITEIAEAFSCPYFGLNRRPAPVVYWDRHRVYKRSFLSIAGAKVQQFGVENKFFRYRFFRGVCKCLTDSVLQWYFGNQLLHFDWFWRKWRLVTQNFRKAVIWSWSCSVKIIFIFLPIMPPSMVTTSLAQDLSLLRKVLKHERWNIWKARLRKSMIPQPRFINGLTYLPRKVSIMIISWQLSHMIA